MARDFDYYAYLQDKEDEPFSVNKNVSLVPTPDPDVQYNDDGSLTLGYPGQDNSQYLSEPTVQPESPGAPGYSQYFGSPPDPNPIQGNGLSTRAQLLEQDAQKHDDKAMNILRNEVLDKPDVSPYEVLSMALLTAIPAIGGTMIGKRVGKAKLSPASDFSLEELKQLQGASTGGAAGAQIGKEAGDKYYASLENAWKNKNARLKEVAKAEFAQGKDERKTASQERAANIRASLSEIERDQSFQNQKKLIDYRNSLKSEENFSDPLITEALAAVTQDFNYKPTPEQAAALAKNLKAMSAFNDAKKRGGYSASVDANISGEGKIRPKKETKEAVKGYISATGILDFLDSKIATADPNALTRSIKDQFNASDQSILNQQLKLLAVEARKAKESGVMTDKDLERYTDYFQIHPTDTVASLQKRLSDYREFMRIGTQATLRAARASKENVDDLEELIGLAPSLSPSSTPVPPSGSPAPIPQEGGGGGLPMAGQVYNGSKVLSVKRVK